MAQVTITVPDAQVSRVIEAFEDVLGGRREGDNDAQYARRVIVNYIREIVLQHEVKQFQLQQEDALMNYRDTHSVDEVAVE